MIIPSRRMRTARSTALASSRTFPGQWMAQERRAGAVVEAGDRAAGALRGLDQDGLGERHDVLGALAQGGQLHPDDVQPEVQIGAELTVLDHPLEVAVGGGDDADVDGDGVIRADRGDGLFLQDAQELGLRRQRQVADLVEEQGAAVGGGDVPGARREGAGERPLGVAEELGLDERLRDGGAIQRAEGPIGARRGPVEGLARAAPCRCRSRR